MNRQDQGEYALQLHQRLIHSDPVASSEFAEAFLEELVRRLRARAARAGYAADDTLIKDAAVDALLNYFQEPSKFDPNRSALMTYLTMSAFGDLRNLTAQQSRRRQREVPFEDVEHRLAPGNNVVEDVEEEAFLRYGILTSEGRVAFLDRVAAEFPDPQDRQVLSLMLAGERRTAAYSKVLGLETRDRKEQQRMVKRCKDRIDKRLKRFGEKLREQR